MVRFSAYPVFFSEIYTILKAIVTSHNIIIVHNQLIRFPDIAFFVSPIPLHIAAMVILYGHMSHCERLTRQEMIEDVWMALDMLPRFRWRWERKDLNGGHPLISKLAEKVLNVNLRAVGPTKDPVLLSELDWETDSPGMLASPALSAQPHLRVHPGTPTMSHSPYSNNGGMGPGVYGPLPRGASANSNSVKGLQGSMSNGTTQDKLAEVPTGLFYPFYPENLMSAAPTVSGPHDDGGTDGDAQDPQGYGHLLAAAAQPNGTYGCQPSSETYMLEEIVPTQGNQVWMNVVSHLFCISAGDS
jgi:hypothetical protein